MRKLMGMIVISFVLLVLGACGGTDGTTEGTQSNSEGTTEDTQSVDSMEEIELRLGLVVGDWAPYYDGAQAWADLLDEESDGKVKVSIYGDGQIGGEREMLEAVQNGSLDLAIISASVFANFEPRMSVLDIPYLVTNYDEAEELIDGEIGEVLNEIWIESDVRSLAWGHADFRMISNNKHAIESPEDISGVKMRLPENKAITSWFQSLGALVEHLPTHEQYTALQQGVVDGQENGPILNFAGKYYEHQKYATITNHIYSPVTFFVSENVWNTLSTEVQNLLEETAKEASIIERELIKSFTDEALKSMEEDGLEIIELSEEKLEEFKQTTQSTIEEVRDLAGDELTDLILEEAEKITN